MASLYDDLDLVKDWIVEGEAVLRRRYVDGRNANQDDVLRAALRLLVMLMDDRLNFASSANGRSLFTFQPWIRPTIVCGDAAPTWSKLPIEDSSDEPLFVESK